MYKKKPIFKYSLILFLLCFSVFYLYPKVKNKYYSTTKRLRLIDSKLESYGNHLVNNIENYQNTRKPNKVISEVKDNIIFDWKELEVPWDKSKFERTKALTVWNDSLVVGLEGAKIKGASIYIYDKKKWLKLIGDNNNVWDNLTKVSVLKVHNGELFAGIDNTIWKLNKEKKWSLIKTFTNQDAYSMASHNGYLYVGLIGKGSSIYRLNKSSWEKISLGLDEHPNSGIYEMFSHTDSNLYASNISTSNSTVVYKLDEENLKWTAIGGKGINASWINSSFTYGYSMSSHKNLLFVTMNRSPKVYGKFSSVWVYDGNQWYAIGNKNPPKIWNEVDVFNTSLSFNDIFFIGVGGSPSGNASVWALNNNQWKIIGGKGVNQSWGLNFPHSLTEDFRNTSTEYPYKFIKFNNSMIVGFGDAWNADTLWQLKVKEK
jgi:hypothetical protein